METLLKSAFPRHRIYNASDKDDKEREFIIQLCIKIENILMYVVRNDNNEQFFKKYELKHSNTRIGFLFFNKDDYMFFPDYTYYQQTKQIGNKSMVLTLKRFVNGEANKCCVCYDEFEIKNLVFCGQCGLQICKKCLFSYVSKANGDVVCPVCKTFVFAKVQHQ